MSFFDRDAAPFDQFVRIPDADASQGMAVRRQPFLAERRACHPEHKTDPAMAERQEVRHHLHAAPGMVGSHGIYAGINRRCIADQDHRVAASDDVAHLFGHTIMEGQDDQQAIHAAAQDRAHRLAFTNRDPGPY